MKHLSELSNIRKLVSLLGKKKKEKKIHFPTKKHDINCLYLKPKLKLAEVSEYEVIHIQKLSFTYLRFFAFVIIQMV